MSIEMFVYPDDDAPRRSLAQLQADLAQSGARCRIEELADGPWLVLDGYQTDMSVTVDPDGSVTGAMVQCNDSPAVLDLLFTAFERLGWVIAGEDG